jgi:sigma-B regulation protein RsbU (phosphoserine phosphatase)
MPDDDGEYMQCMEVWGDSALTTKAVKLGGLDAWVYSKPFGEAQRGGDVYYASSCATGRISRLLLADVSGHGHSVASTAADLRTLMRRFVNRLDQKEFVRLLNQQFLALSRTGTFATAVVTTFFAPSRRLLICNAGHPRPLLYRAAKKQWTLLGDDGVPEAAKPQNIPLGIIDLTEYEEIDVELEPGDYFMKYTDALIESRDADGEMFGEAGVLRILNLLGEIDPDKLIPAFLKEIRERYPENLTEDDVTVMLIRVNGRQPRVPFGEKLAAVGRFFGTLARSVKPGNERPPMPDFSLANVGGAIIPALGRRWRPR